MTGKKGCGACRRLRQVHHRLREIAALGIGGDAVGEFVDRRLRRRHRLLDGEKPRYDALDIPVDHHCAPAEGDRGNGGGRVAADPRQLQQFGFGVGEAPAMLAHDGPGAGDEIAGTRIIAEPGPGGHHLRLVGVRQRLHARPAAGELLKIGNDGGDGRLLQHHFRQPDPIGIGRLAARRAPGKRSFIHSIPAEQGI
jgi:hypothetical protein